MKSYLLALLSPYPLTVIAAFVLPLAIERNIEPWPGRLIATFTFVVLAVAAIALEKDHNRD